MPGRERSGVRASPRAAEAASGPGRSAPPQGRVPHSPAGPGSAGAASSSRRRRRQRQLRAARAIVPRVGPALPAAVRLSERAERWAYAAGPGPAPRRPRAGPLRPPPAAPRTRGGRRGHRPLLGAAVAPPARGFRGGRSSLSAWKPVPKGCRTSGQGDGTPWGALQKHNSMESSGPLARDSSGNGKGEDIDSWAPNQLMCDMAT